MSQKSRHIPERSCVSCGTKMPKEQLVRIVKTSQGPVNVDTTGREPGRGAYLCRTTNCWSRALNKGALARSFKQSLSARDLEPIQTHYQENIAPQNTDSQL